jgi:Flp pilus assembly protein TadG
LNDCGKPIAAPTPRGLRPQRLLGWLARLYRARGGVTAVETAFLMPVLLTFLLGIEEFGRALWTQTALQYAAEAAARCAAVKVANCTPDVPTYAANQAFGLSIPASDFTYTASASCGIAGYTDGAQVTASHVFDPIVSQLVPVSVTLYANSSHP